jgi:hypothetical protein
MIKFVVIFCEVEFPQDREPHAHHCLQQLRYGFRRRDATTNLPHCDDWRNVHPAESLEWATGGRQTTNQLALCGAHDFRIVQHHNRCRQRTVIPFDCRIINLRVAQPSITAGFRLRLYRKYQDCRKQTSRQGEMKMLHHKLRFEAV